MKKYLFTQLKRMARFLPWALAVVLILFGCVTLVYHYLAEKTAAETAQKEQKVRIAMVGTAQDQYLQWGLALMQLDSSAMSLELTPMEEAAAVDALEQGRIAAYVVFPEGFVEEAMGGNVVQLQVVSTAGASGLVSLVKGEILTVIDRILVACESGSFGVGDAVLDQGDPANYGKYVDGLALEYVELLFDRSAMYQVETLPPNRLPLDQYMLGGLTVVLLLLSALSFAPLYIRRDLALSQVLQARGIRPAQQALAELAAFLVAMLGLLAVVVMLLWLGNLPPAAVSLWTLFVGMLPTMLLVVSFAFCMYSLSDHLIGGVLLTFFGILALSFAGGCLYPVHVFPESLQRLAGVLPTGIACRSLIACFTGVGAAQVPALLGYSGALGLLAVAIRCAKNRR